MSQYIKKDEYTAEMRQQFWKYGINPIVGYKVPVAKTRMQSVPEVTIEPAVNLNRFKSYRY